MIIYKAIGIVLGETWMGNKGIFDAEEYEASSMDELDKQINEGIKDNSIDSGFGFKKIIGACMGVQKIEKKIIDNKEFIHYEEPEIVFYGDIPFEDSKLIFEYLINS